LTEQQFKWDLFRVKRERVIYNFVKAIKRARSATQITKRVYLNLILKFVWLAFVKKKSALKLCEAAMAFYAKFMVSHGISNIIDGHNRKMRKCCTYKFQILNKTVFKEAKKLLQKFLHGVFA
jgi:hypothetical protein